LEPYNEHTSNFNLSSKQYIEALMNGRFAIGKLDITTHLFNFFNQILRRVFLEQKHFICPSLKVRILVEKIKIQEVK
jgi:hypothetical protein